MGWTHQQGHKGKQGIRRGGAFLTVQEQWRAEVHKVKSDNRVWGRYVMREMLGRSGASMVVVSLYPSTKSGARESGRGAWDWQVQQMGNPKARLQKNQRWDWVGQARQVGAESSGVAGHSGGWRQWRCSYPCQSGTAGPGCRPGQDEGRV